MVVCAECGSKLVSNGECSNNACKTNVDKVIDCSLDIMKSITRAKDREESK